MKEEDYPPNPENLEIINEAVTGKPTRHGSTSAAIAVMQRRLEHLRAEKAQTLSALEDCEEGLRRTLIEDLNNLNRELETAQRRLDDYCLQQQSEN